MNIQDLPPRFVRGAACGLVVLFLAAGAAHAAIPAGERQALLDLYASTNGAGWARTGWNGPAGTECTWFGVTCNAAQTTVTALGLQFNDLSRPLPASIGSLPGLAILSLYSNQLSGSIPSLAANTDLHTLRLEGNQLSGPLPSFASNPALRILSLHSNQLFGSIPSLADNTALRVLGLESNQLSGPIPSFAGAAALQYPRLSHNRLSGPLPSFASNTGLRALGLNSNQLTGSVHPSLGTLTNLMAQALDLRWNGLSSTDAALIAFLNSKQFGGSGQGTQTIPVTGLSVRGVLQTLITVNWIPITYTGGSGHYQVFYSTATGGPHTPVATVTASKLASSPTVTGLTPLTPYFFAVQTTTAPHANNQNTVVSGYSADVGAMTTPVELLRLEVE